MIYGITRTGTNTVQLIRRFPEMMFLVRCYMAEWFFPRLMRKVMEIHTRVFAADSTPELLRSLQTQLDAERAERCRRFDALDAGIAAILAEVRSFHPTVLPGVETCADPSAALALVADLGVLTIPAEYVHGTYPAAFREQYGQDFVGMFDTPISIGRASVTNTVRELMPGDRLHVQIFEQGESEKSMFDVWKPFVETHRAVLPGIRGLMLLYELVANKLPANQSIISLDGSTACSTAGRLRIDIQEDGSTRRYLDQTPTRATGAACLLVRFTDASK